MSTFIEQRSQKIYQFDELHGRDVVPFPRELMIEPTNACNLACVFCYNRLSTRKKTLLDTELCKSILHEAYTLGSRNVGFYMTGEPLLHPNIATFVNTAKTIGYEYIYITTNGVFAKKELAESCIKAGLMSLKISLNSYNREHYIQKHGRDCFNDVLLNIEEISKLRLKYGDVFNKFMISSVVAEEDQLDFENFRKKMLHAYAIDEYRLLELVSHPLAGHAKAYKNNICPQLFNRCHITAEGYMTCCCVDFENDLAFADLGKVSLKEAWDSEIIKKIRTDMLMGKLGTMLCSRCMGKGDETVVPINTDLYGAPSRVRDL